MKSAYSLGMQLTVFVRLLLALLPALFFLSLFLLFIQNDGGDSLCNQILLHLRPRFAVGGIGSFLLGQNFGVLRIQFLDAGQLFHTHLVKGILGRPVQRDFFPMFFQKLFAVPGLAVGHISQYAGLGA